MSSRSSSAATTGPMVNATMANSRLGLALTVLLRQEPGTNQRDSPGQNAISMTDNIKIIRNGKVAA